MSRKGKLRVLKTAGQCFSVTAGVVTLAMSIIGAYVTIPAVATYLAVSCSGLTFGILGGCAEAQRPKNTTKKKRRARALQDNNEADNQSSKDELETTACPLSPVRSSRRARERNLMRHNNVNSALFHHKAALNTLTAAARVIHFSKDSDDEAGELASLTQSLIQ